MDDGAAPVRIVDQLAGCAGQVGLIEKNYVAVRPQTQSARREWKVRPAKIFVQDQPAGTMWPQRAAAPGFPDNGGPPIPPCAGCLATRAVGRRVRQAADRGSATRRADVFSVSVRACGNPVIRMHVANRGRSVGADSSNPRSAACSQRWTRRPIIQPSRPRRVPVRRRATVPPRKSRRAQTSAGGSRRFPDRGPTSAR